MTAHTAKVEHSRLLFLQWASLIELSVVIIAFQAVDDLYIGILERCQVPKYLYLPSTGVRPFKTMRALIHGKRSETENTAPIY